MEMEQLVSKITAEILNNIQNQGGLGRVCAQGNSSGNVAGMIDHTLLKQNASEEQIKKLCQEAREYHFCSVCVNPSYVPLCYEEASRKQREGLYSNRISFGSNYN